MPDGSSSGVRRAWLIRLGLLLVAVVVMVLVVRLVGRVDWGEVWRGLGQLAWWQVPVLAAVLVARQVLNSVPLALYIPGISLYKATLNDQVAILMGTVAPPPSDLALRTSMFSSWGVPIEKGLAGTVMNMLTFYIMRFGAPAIGFVVLFAAGGEVGVRWADTASIAISVAIVVGVLLVVRSDGLARTLGLHGGLVVRRVRRSVDPQAWADACARFRVDIAARFHRGFPRSLLALCAMLAVDLMLLVLCLRFVGISAGEVAMVWIAIAYLFAYPATMFPFAGIGILDALVVAGIVGAGGAAVEAPALAALLVWRVFTIGGPLILGAIGLAAWRRSVRSDDVAEGLPSADV